MTSGPESVHARRQMGERIEGWTGPTPGPASDTIRFSLASGGLRGSGPRRGPLKGAVEPEEPGCRAHRDERGSGRSGTVRKRRRGATAHEERAVGPKNGHLKGGALLLLPAEAERTPEWSRTLPPFLAESVHRVPPRPIPPLFL